MPDHFESSKQLLARAKEHVIDCERKIAAFFALKPHRSVIEADPNGTDKIHKITLTKSVPASVANAGADAVNCLRSVLDHAAYASAVASGKVKPRHTYFPFGPDADFNRSGKGGCKNVPPDVVTLMRAFKPYRTGNDLLWAINQASVANKHSLLTPVGIITKAMHIRKVEARGGKFMLHNPHWDGIKNEIVLATVSPDTKIHYDADLAFDVTFREVEFIAGQPAIGVLNAMTREVERILMAIETETRRLFPNAFV
jgi:hypothetical protein